MGQSNRGTAFSDVPSHGGRRGLHDPSDPRGMPSPGRSGHSEGVQYAPA